MTINPSVAVGVALALLDVHRELVLLVASHVGVAHVEDEVVVLARRRGHKVQLDLGLLLQGQALDGQQRVGLGVADHHPPALFAFLWRLGYRVV